MPQSMAAAAQHLHLPGEDVDFYEGHVGYVSVDYVREAKHPCSCT